VTGTLHTTRHTHATLALTNGVPLHVVAARLGDRPETILKTCAHLLPQSDVEAAEQVAALIAGWHLVCRRAANPHGCAQTLEQLILSAEDGGDRVVLEDVHDRLGEEVRHR
jgi:hypothetical protein